VPAVSPLDEHLTALVAALPAYRRAATKLHTWGTHLAHTLTHGHRLLVAGNGGSAAETQHLTAELVGKLHHDRPPLSAIALTAETSSLTAIANDYGYHHTFARQVAAHGRPGDTLLLMTTSGTSENLLHAAHTATTLGITTWAFTGPTPNPLATACTDTLPIDSPHPQIVQELHLVSTHLLCEHLEAALGGTAGPTVRGVPVGVEVPAEPVTHRPGPAR
jgi:D-sedoheptulose 7-phosphate isomerase